MVGILPGQGPPLPGMELVGDCYWIHSVVVFTHRGSRLPQVHVRQHGLDGKTPIWKNTSHVERTGSGNPYPILTTMLATTLAVAPAAAEDAVSAPMLDFLAWVGRAPRTYADVMEAWRSSCPRFTVWEDALRAGLVQVERAPGRPFGEDRIALTTQGQAVHGSDTATRRTSTAASR
jgi:hypothetical protein